MDLSNISVKVAATLGGFAALVIFGLSLLSYSAKEPYMIYGKEFGFGSKELSQRTAELAELKTQLSLALKEKADLMASNMELLNEKRTRAARESDMWFPIDDVDFKQDGTYTIHGGRRAGRGKWATPDSEISLQMSDIKRGEVILETNLSPPSNKIRLTGQAIRVPMQSWEYRLQLVSSDYESALVRIERRAKARN